MIGEKNSKKFKDFYTSLEKSNIIGTTTKHHSKTATVWYFFCVKLLMINHNEILHKNVLYHFGHMINP